MTVILVIAIAVRRQYVAPSSAMSSETVSPPVVTSGKPDDDDNDGGCAAVVVTKFVLWDATTSERLDDTTQHERLQLTDHAALCAGDLPAKVNIEAVVVETKAASCALNATSTTTVVMDLLGTPPRHRTEYTSPYMLAGHNQGRVFKMNLPVGPYALSAMANDYMPGRLEVAFRVFDC
jgi:hypothetical protein